MALAGAVYNVPTNTGNTNEYKSYTLPASRNKDLGNARPKFASHIKSPLLEGSDL